MPERILGIRLGTYDMSQESWVKLYRKISDNEIIRDGVALQIFIFLMTNVDRHTGEMIIGRFLMSDILGLHPSSFYRGLKRLAEKYKVVTLTPNNRNTKVKLIHWAKYQGDNQERTQVSNNKRTTSEQQANTYTRIENRELRSIPHQTMRCPLEENSPLKTKYPNGHKECIEFIDSVASLKGHKFTNYQKQIGVLHKMLRAERDFEAIAKAAKKIKTDEFYVDKGWDLATVAAQLDRS